MRIAKVVGVAVATVNDRRLEGAKLLLVAPADSKGQTQAAAPFVAQDLVGAGEGELVLMVEGSSARTAAGDANRPVDAAMVGILDSLSSAGQVTYKKS